MKKNFIWMIAAILTICGAVMTTSCSIHDNPASGDKYVTATFTASFESVAQTRAISENGDLLFATDDKVAVLYENTSGEMVKAISNEVATPGPTATFTVTMVNPKAGGNLQCLYPASMASDDDSTYEALFTEQDGTLETFNEKFHLALYKGYLTADATVPSSIELVNRLAICKLTVKDGDNDITSAVTKLAVEYGDYKYSLSTASVSPIWLGLIPVEDSDIIVYAVKGDELFMGTIPGPLKAGKPQDITVNVTKVTKMVFNITVNRADDDATTQAVKTDWESGDKVYVFFESVTGAKYVQLDYNGTAWEATLKGGLSADILTATGKQMYAVHFPYEQPVIAADGDGVTFKRVNEQKYKGQHIFTYYMTASAPYTITTANGISTLAGTLDMVIPDGYVQFFIDKSGTDIANFRYRLSLAGVKPTACVSYSNGTFGIKALAAAQPMWGYAHGSEGVAFSGVIDDTWSNSGNEHLVYLFDTQAPARYTTLYGKTLSSHSAVKFKEATINSWYKPYEPSYLTFQTQQGITKWATINLGETKEAVDNGWFFQWGDIIPGRSEFPVPNIAFGSESYYQQTAIYDAIGYSNGFELNNGGDDQRFDIYDMVRAFLGPDWRMPSWDECYNLLVALQRNELKVIKDYQSYSVENVHWDSDSGTSLWYFYSDDKDCFFRGAGYWINGNFYSQNDTEQKVYYWSRKRYDTGSKAYSFQIGKDILNAPTYSLSPMFCWMGLTVRPIYDK